MLRVKERMKVEFSRSITLPMLALFHRTGQALKTVLTNRYTCTPHRRLAGRSEFRVGERLRGVRAGFAAHNADGLAGESPVVGIDSLGKVVSDLVFAAWRGRAGFRFSRRALR